MRVGLVRVSPAFMHRYVWIFEVCFALYAFHWLSCAGMSEVLCLLSVEPVKLASAWQVRGVGVGCEALQRRSILQILRMDLAPLGLSINLHILAFRVG